MSTEPNSIVIVGGGQAGAWAAKTLRDEGYAGEISLISEEAHAPYERPPLSKKVLAGKSDPLSVSVFSPEVLERMQLRWLRPLRVSAIQRRQKHVTLSDGTTVDYDKLILCTGGRAWLPPIAGIDLPGVFTLRTLDDCRNLSQALQSARRVCVVGGGWIGLEVASTAAGMGKHVTVLERSAVLCGRVLPQPLSEEVLRLHREAGVDVRLDVMTEAIRPSRPGLQVLQGDGQRIEADVVVLGVGLRPNDELASEAGLACDRGIVVDSRCITSDPDILAAGDVAVAPNPWAGGLVRLESWQNAQEQAVVAAKVALGKTAVHEPLPWFWSDQHGANIQILGFPRPGLRAVTRMLPGANSKLTFLLDGERVVAAVAVNAARELRMCRKLIEQRKAVHESLLADPSERIASL